MPKLLIYSDLHTEWASFRILEHAYNEADVIVFAGDIFVGDQDPQTLYPANAPPKPYIYVPGNHEYYDKSDVLIGKTWESRFCEIISGVRYLNTTLWTDMQLRGNRDMLLDGEAIRHLNDFDRIRHCGIKFEPMDWLRLHEQQRERLVAHLRQKFDGPTVVVTHHAPHEQSCDPQYGGAYDGLWASDLSGIIHTYKPALWIHGHVHKSNDYRIGETRVVSNPRGYHRRVTENPNFNPNFIVEV